MVENQTQKVEESIFDSMGKGNRCCTKSFA